MQKDFMEMVVNILEYLKQIEIKYNEMICAWRNQKGKSLGGTGARSGRCLIGIVTKEDE